MKDVTVQEWYLKILSGNPEVTEGVMREESLEVLKSYFETHVKG